MPGVTYPSSLYISILHWHMPGVTYPSSLWLLAALKRNYAFLLRLPCSYPRTTRFCLLLLSPGWEGWTNGLVLLLCIPWIQRVFHEERGRIRTCCWTIILLVVIVFSLITIFLSHTSVVLAHGPYRCAWRPVLDRPSGNSTFLASWTLYGNHQF